MTKISRRDFLNVSANALLSLAGLLGLGGLIRFLSYQYDASAPTEFDIGLPTDYPPGTRTILADIPAIVIHDNNGIRAMSLVCPHLGCAVGQDLQGFTCPCHGSRYDSEGKLTKGPATKSLKSLRVEKTEEGGLRVIIN